MFGGGGEEEDKESNFVTENVKNVLMQETKNSHAAWALVGRLSKFNIYF